MKLFSKNSKKTQSRDGVIIKTSVLGIIVNVIISAIKVIVGFSVSSIAIISEGINNATDSATSLITIVGTKLSKKKPTRKHPFGYGRIEYLTSLIISIIIFVTGFELLINSIKLIITPKALAISYITIIIILATAIIKLALSIYTINQGKKINSTTLVALGIDCRNDCITSAVTIVSSLIFIFFDFSIDSYAGIITSLFVLKAGYDILKDTIADLLGQAGNKELADKLYKIIRSEPVILNAADMMLHNYGPDSYSASVNIEVDHEKTIGEIYTIIHSLQLKIMHEYNITMVFGMYAVDQDHDIIKEMRMKISEFVRNHKNIESYHALYVDPVNNDIYCDFVVDYELKDWDSLKQEFNEYMKNLYPNSRLELVIETNFV